MHGLANRIVAAERKGNVAHPAADPRVGQVLFDPARGLDEIDSVVVVLLDAGGHGEDVRIENDVFRREADFLDKDLVGAAADFFAALEVVRLTLFVEGHDNHGRAVTHDLTGLFLEFLLPLFERDGVHHTLALHAAEAGFDHLELRGVDHDRDLRDIRLAGDKLEEFGHGRRSIEHPLVHVDVDDLRAGLDLLTRHGERLVVLVAEDELGEFRRAGDVGALADVDERDFGARGEGFESAQTQSARASRNAARLEIARRFDDGRNVIRRRAAATADDVQPSLLGPVAELRGERFGRLGESGRRQRVGQAGVRVSADMERRKMREFLDVRAHFLGSERAVQPDAEQREVCNGIKERFGGLAGQGASAQVGDRARDHDRQADLFIGEILRDGVERGFAVERVENGLNEKDVHPAGDEFVHLIAVSRSHLLESHFARARIIDVAGNGQGLAHRADRSGDKDAAIFASVCRLARQLGRREVQVGHDFLHPVVGLRNGRAVEGVRLDQVRARRDVLLVDAADDVRLGQDEQVVVAFDIARPILETLPAVGRFIQLVPLDHRAHRTIEVDDALGHQTAQSLGCVRLGHDGKYYACGAGMALSARLASSQRTSDRRLSDWRMRSARLGLSNPTSSTPRRPSSASRQAVRAQSIAAAGTLPPGVAQPL